MLSFQVRLLEHKCPEVRCQFWEIIHKTKTQKEADNTIFEYPAGVRERITYRELAHLIGTKILDIDAKHGVIV